MYPDSAFGMAARHHGGSGRRLAGGMEAAGISASRIAAAARALVSA